MAQPPKRGPGRPRKTPAAKPKAPDDADLIGTGETEEKISSGISEVYGGVSSKWLATMFGHDTNTIETQLAKANLEIVGRRTDSSLYRLHGAAPLPEQP